MKKIIFTDIQIKEIIKKYQEKYSLKDIGKDYSCSESVITRVLKANDYFIFDRKKRKYVVDESYFENIDTPNKAYILGFLAADGNVSVREQNNSGAIRINIKTEDKNILDFIKLEMKSTHNVKFRAGAGFGLGTELCNLEINSIKLCKALVKIGIVPNKSLVLQPPNIPKAFYLPFIKGYFDGDGTIYKTNNTFVIGFCGTKEMLNWIQSILGTNQKLEKRRKDNTNNYSFRIGGVMKPYSIISKFYETTDISIKRKNNLYQELKSRLQK